MHNKRYQTRLSPSSSSSRDDTAVYASDQFFAPEYPAPDIKSSGSQLRSSGPYPQASRSRQASSSSASSPEYYVDTATSYALHDMRVAGDGAQAGVHTPLRSGKHALSASLVVDGSANAPGLPPNKKSRRGSGNAGGGRVQGACARCKRLKMKCTFDDNRGKCARCLTGDYDCEVRGRKPRSPGPNEIMRKEIKTKDARIDNVLAQLNPASPSATPLAINPARLVLTPEERVQYRDTLVYLEKSQGGTARSAANESQTKHRIDISALEPEFEDDDDDSGGSIAGLQESTAALHIQQLPGTHAPVGMMARAALKSRSSLSRRSSPASTPGPSSSEDGQQTHDDADGRGIGNPAYFDPGPYSNLDIRRLIVERQAAPDILLSGLITNDDVQKLFDIYFKWINPVMSLLDEAIHTPSRVLIRCPFLFTVVCAIASRFYDEKPSVYAMAIHMAKAAAANALLDGCKTVEMCQAFALMASYMPPARRWEEDRAFFYSGLAFRLAIDLDLRRAPSEMPEDERMQREILNRLRTHIICYIIDRSFCLNLGKPFMIPEDELIRNAGTQFYGFDYSLDSDRYLVSLVELFRIMTRFAELANPAMRPANESLDLYGTHKVFTEELRVWEQSHNERCAEDLAPGANAHDRLRMALMFSVFQYCRLITYSVGMQHILKQGRLEQDSLFFVGCLQTASAIVNCVTDRILPTGFIRYAPEHVFALSAYATSVLSQFSGPDFVAKIEPIQKRRIDELFRRLLNAVNPNDLSTDETPTPRRSFADFLAGIIESWAKRHNEQSSSSNPMPTSNPEPEPAESAGLPDAPEMASTIAPETGPPPTPYPITPVETPDPQTSTLAYLPVSPSHGHPPDLAQHAVHPQDAIVYPGEWCATAQPIPPLDQAAAMQDMQVDDPVAQQQLQAHQHEQQQMQLQQEMLGMTIQPWFSFNEFELNSAALTGYADPAYNLNWYPVSPEY